MSLQAQAARVPSKELYKALLSISVVFSCAILIFYVATVRFEQGFLRDYAGFVVGRDLVNSWMMGHSALNEENPAANYALEVYGPKLRSLLGPEYPLQQWSYPPNYVAAMLPLGLLPYGYAYGCWLIGSLALLWVAVARTEASGRLGFFLMMLASPAGLLGLISGQMSFVFTALQILIFSGMEQRPKRVGVLLGIISIKPHLGLLYPFFLFVTSRWQLIGAACVTTLGLILVSVFVMGHESWTVFISTGISQQYSYVLRDTPEIITWLMPTMYIDVRALTGSHAAGLVVQVLSTFLVILLMFMPRFKRLPSTSKLLVFASGTMMMTPYLMAYDMLFFSYAVIRCVRECSITRFGGLLLFAAYWVPAMHFFMGAMGVFGSAFLFPAVMLWVLFSGEKDPR